MSTFTLTPGYFGPQVTGKLGRMRKPQSWSAQPASDGSIIVQSDKSIGQFFPGDPEGRFTTKGSYFPHLAMAERFTFPSEFIALAEEACLARGGTTTKGGVTLVNTITVIGKE